MKSLFKNPMGFLFLIVLLAGTVLGFYLFRKESVKSGSVEEAPRPLTDMAPPPPVVDVKAEEGPQGRLEKLNLPPPPQANVEVLLPEGGMDVRNPPQWTKTIARPAAHPVPPDPFTPPPIQVDPRRRPEPEIERLPTGTYGKPE